VFCFKEESNLNNLLYFRSF